jgi:hypothetical protein
MSGSQFLEPPAPEDSLSPVSVASESKGISALFICLTLANVYKFTRRDRTVRSRQDVGCVNAAKSK